VLGDVVRFVVVVISTMAMGYAMGFRIHGGVLGAVGGSLLAVLFGLCLSWVSVVVGLSVRTSGAVQGILFLILVPLSFASNVFVSPASLPGWMQAFVKVNPLTHLVGAVRALYLGQPAGDHVLWTLAWCAGFVVIFVPLALRAYRRKV
jgi:oleandomycin transport system permease protein